ncbi:MAG: DUF11 domain-containing protein, partial [Anaerolineae bacterium]|nr:DUF11 domain-containing protein [Anaerolineae bacterium]
MDSHGNRHPGRWVAVATAICAALCLLTLGRALVLAHDRAPEPAVGSAPPLFDSPLQIEVHYGEEWVAGQSIGLASAAVTLTDGSGVPKADAVVPTGADGSFWVGCGDWSGGACPDIQPGDSVHATVDESTASVDPVGQIEGLVDAASDVVSGTVHAGWFEGMLETRCVAWKEPSHVVVTAAAGADGGTFACDFAAAGWDLQRGDALAISYAEPDGDLVTNAPFWPWVRVNYAHDWVGADYPAGHTFAITVTDSLGGYKATAFADTSGGGGWGADGFETGEEQWAPERPEIVAGDHVYAWSDDGYARHVQVGAISATLDVAADQIAGTIAAPWLSETLAVECHPWGAWEAGLEAPIKHSTASPDGTTSFACQWDPDTEWDVQPGQDIAVLYYEPDGSAVIDVYRQPIADLRIALSAEGEVTSDGNAQFTIRYWNQGDAPAAGVAITDTMVGGMSYLTDTSGLPHSGSGAGPIVWDVGTIDPGQAGSFALYAQVTASPGGIVTNTVEIATTSPDGGEPWDKSATWLMMVHGNDTRLRVEKGARTPDPAPGHDVVFQIAVCNEGSTGSSEVVLADTPAPPLELVGWSAREPGWREVYLDPGQLQLALPTIPGGACREVYVTAHLDGVEPGAHLANVATIAAENDTSTGDDEAIWEGAAAEPYVNLGISKEWTAGVLRPGGQLVYQIGYGNDGNVPTGPVWITDRLPISATFASAWHHDPWGGYPFEPVTVTNEYVSWEIPILENGSSGGFEVVLDVDPGAAPGYVEHNEVEIASPAQERTYGDNTSSWTEMLREAGPNLRVRKTHQWQGDGQLGYAIHFANAGDAPVIDVWITDTLPVGTHWIDQWQLEFDREPLGTGYDGGRHAFAVHLDEMHPGEAGWLALNVHLDEPGAPVRWYTNTVEIGAPGLDDVHPADNAHEDVAFGGGELRRVELWVDDRGPSAMWGEAIPGLVVTVTTPHELLHAWADPEQGGYWEIGDVGLLEPGDRVTVTAGVGLLPVAVTIPKPLLVEADAATDVVSGAIGGWAERPVEIHGQWEGGYREAISAPDGGFEEAYADIPRGAHGYVRFVDQVSYAEVVFHRPFWALDLVLDVHVDHDQVEGRYEPGHTVWITVTEGNATTVKGLAELHTGEVPGWEEPGFSTREEGWSTAWPDLAAGDWVTGHVDNGFTGGVRIGAIDFQVDLAADLVSGTLDADWFDEWLMLRCEVWAPGGPAVELEVDPHHGPFSCAFGQTGWDLAPGQTVAVMYWEPDGDRVIRTFEWPHIAAHIGPSSGGDRRVWGHAAAPDASVAVSVTDDLGKPVASAVTPSDWQGRYDTGDTLPEGTLAPWNVVWVDFANGLTDKLEIYPMSGEADPESDVVTLTAAGYVTFELGLEYCAGNECDWIDLGWLSYSGIVSVNLMSERGFDVRPDTSYHAHMYVENGQELIYSWSLLAPRLSVAKWNTAGHARPGGPYAYLIEYRNDGSAPAENVTLVDTLPPFASYVDDTSGLPVTLGPAGAIAWDVGPLEPGAQHVFALTVAISESAPTGEGILDPNCVAIQTSTAGDPDPGDDSACSDPVDVWEDEVELAVDKRVRPDDPAPGQEFEYTVQWCNQRGAAAGPVTLTDTLPAWTTLVEWWPRDPGQPFWSEVSSSGGELVLYAASLPGQACGEIALRVALALEAEIGATLSNMVVLDVAGDVDPENNWRLHQEAHVGAPRIALEIHKSAQAAVLLPGGWVQYLIEYDNAGNTALPTTLTETVPAGMAYVDAWWADDMPPELGPLPNPIVSGDLLIWELPEIPVGDRYALYVLLQIDEGVDEYALLENCATVGGAAPGADPHQDTACAAVTIYPPGPNLRVTKWHEWRGEEQLGYTIRFQNVGDQAVGEVWITDTLPEGTHWSGEWNLGFDEQRLVLPEPIVGDRSLAWLLSELAPGDVGWLQFRAGVDDPGAPGHFYTNTVEITLPPDDSHPGDNAYQDVAFSGPEVRRLELDVYGHGIWGDAPRGPITITTPHTQVVLETEGAFSWESPDPLLPGETVTVAACEGALPVHATLPDPFDAHASSIADEVWGQVDHLDRRWLEVELLDGTLREVQTDPDGNYAAAFPDIPRAGQGEVRYPTEIDDTDVVYHRGFRSPDLILLADYDHDWLGGDYQGPGQTVFLTVTDAGGATKAAAEVTLPPGGGWWSTDEADWAPERPDIDPGDRVHGIVDGGPFTTTLRVGAIPATVDVEHDAVSGTVEAPWVEGLVTVRCEIHEPEGPDGIEQHGVDPKGGAFACDFGGAWDILPGQNVVVRYVEPEQNAVQAH